MTFQLEQQVMTEINAERSRDEWIARNAADRLGGGECIDTIETEPLENLSELIRAELEDRSRVGEHYTDDLPF